MCISPIRIRNPAKFPKTPFVDVPCGKCVECIKRKYNDLNFRLQNEFVMAKKPCYFFTLTYDDNNLPYRFIDADGNYLYSARLRTDLPTNRGCPYYYDFIDGDDSGEGNYAEFNAYPEKSDVIDFVRSMRDKIRYELMKKGLSSKEIKKFTNFKYLIVSEYGDTTNRPHFHGLIYNFPFPIDVFRDMISHWWRRGFVQADYLNSRRIGYTVKYLFKDNNPSKVSLRSKGIGDLKLEQYIYLANNRCFELSNENGVKVNIPKYYRDKLFKLFPSMRNVWDKKVSEFVDTTPESNIDNNHRVRVYEKNARKFNKNRKNKKQIL